MWDDYIQDFYPTKIGYWSRDGYTDYKGDFVRETINGDYQYLGVADHFKVTSSGSLKYYLTDMELDIGQTSTLYEDFGPQSALAFAFAGNDRIAGSDEDDRLLGWAGNDRIEAGEGADLVHGGEGLDHLLGGAGDDRLYGEGGNDRLLGGAGLDKLFGHGGADRLKGQDGDDHLVGGDGSDHLYGGAGSDRLYGGAGDDRLVGDKGKDWLKGGGGADVFVFARGADAGKGKGRDVVRDFSSGEGDRLDLKAVDADEGAKGDQAFDFIGAKGFSKAGGELRFVEGRLAGDTDGDGVADFQLTLRGVEALTADDFLL